MKFVLLLIFYCFVAITNAQEGDAEWQYVQPKQKKSDPKPIAHKLTIGSGISSYSGDLNPSATKLQPELSLALGFRYFIHKKWTIKPQFSYLSLSASDSKTGNSVRNLSFHSKNYEWTVSMVYDFVNYEPRWDLRKKIAPFVYANVGGLFFNPKADYNGKSYDLHSLQTEGTAYNKFTWVSSLGIGNRFAISPRFNLNIDVRYTHTFTDYLDDVSKTYIDIDDLSGVARALADRTMEGGFLPENTINGSHWVEGSARGSRKLNDGYIFMLIELEVDIFSHNVVYPLF